MRYLRRDLVRLSTNQWLTLISLLVIFNLVVLGGLVWVIALDLMPEQAQLRQIAYAQPASTRTPYPTFTPRRGFVTATPWPTSPFDPTETSTLVATLTPSITPTPSPTWTPSVTPTPTKTPYRAPVRVASVPTGTPTNTPTPSFDFAAKVRRLTPCENQGKHHIFMHVLDQNGNAMPGMSAKISWPGGEAIIQTGTKAEDPGLADFAMFKGSYRVELLGVVSQVAGPVTPDIARNELCEENDNPVANSLYHHSYEIIFIKVR